MELRLANMIDEIACGNCGNCGWKKCKQKCRSALNWMAQITDVPGAKNLKPFQTIILAIHEHHEMYLFSAEDFLKENARIVGVGNLDRSYFPMVSRRVPLGTQAYFTRFSDCRLLYPT